MTTSTTSTPEPTRTLSAAQKLLLVVGGLVIAFLILGSVFQANSEGGGLNVGIQTQPFAVLAILSFGGGLLSFVSPCTLPVLTAYFAFAFQSGRSQIAANTIAFMLGLATTFSVFGAIGFALGRVLLRNQQLILLVGGAVIIVFGVMSLLGKGFTGVDPTGSGGVQPRSNSLWGSFLFGLTFAIGWSSCVGPILGSVMTLSAQSNSVFQGAMLLFIYALGLGLPLIVVSTLFGRMDRKSLFWRILRGKGWEWDTHMMVVGVVWALAIWQILVGVTQFAFERMALFGGQEFTAVHNIGLLILALLGAALWVFTSPQEKRTTVHLHSTQLISGALFIMIGLMMINGTLTTFNSLIPPDLTNWFIEIEDKLIALFS